MRQIKFRAWDNYTDKWMETANLNIRMANGLPQLNGSAGIIGGITIVEYTGLKDSKGAEIYEGDIVNIPRVYFPCHIRYEEDQGGFIAEWKYVKKQNYVNLTCDVAEHAKIIGNIYETPELLEADNAKM